MGFDHKEAFNNHFLVSEAIFHMVMMVLTIPQALCMMFVTDYVRIGIIEAIMSTKFGALFFHKAEVGQL